MNTEKFTQLLIDVELIKDQIQRILKLLEGNSKTGIVDKITNLDKKMLEQCRELTRISECLDMSIGEYEKLSDKVNGYLKTTAHIRVQGDEDRQTKLEEFWQTTGKEIIKAILYIVIAYILFQLGASEILLN